MYVGLVFSIPEVSFDLDSFSFEVPICGSSAKHNTAAKKQSVEINPVVFILMRRSNLHACVPSTFLCSQTNNLTAFLEPIFGFGFVLDHLAGNALRLIQIRAYNRHGEHGHRLWCAH